MKILGIDTSGPVASCAVMVDGRIVHSIALNHGLTHSESIMPAVEDCMRASGLTCAEIDCFAAVAGPGSFTGVRIGICAAKGFAHAVNRPCIAVHSLETLAMNFFGFAGRVCPILDARRGQVYTALFDTSGGYPVRAMDDAAIPLTELLDRLPAGQRILFCGDGLGVHSEAILAALGERAILAPANLRDLRAEAACVLAAQRPDLWIPPHALAPIYLRLSQAERSRLNLDTVAAAQ